MKPLFTGFFCEKECDRIPEKEIETEKTEPIKWPGHTGFIFKGNNQIVYGGTPPKKPVSGRITTTPDGTAWKETLYDDGTTVVECLGVPAQPDEQPF
jgi:hypothetical protein